MSYYSPQQLSESIASDLLSGLSFVVGVVVLFGSLAATALAREFSAASVPAAASLDARLQFESRLSKAVRLESWVSEGFALNSVLKNKSRCARAPRLALLADSQSSCACFFHRFRISHAIHLLPSLIAATSASLAV
eukprot:3849269-Pleurochrysis_carterae.AAC.3